MLCAFMMTVAFSSLCDPSVLVRIPAQYHQVVRQCLSVLCSAITIFDPCHPFFLKASYPDHQYAYALFESPFEILLHEPASD